MLDIDVTLLGLFSDESVNSTHGQFLSMPLHQFKWLVYLSLLALHGVIAVIITELMGRTYRKYWLWFIITFFLPVIGAISVWLYHMILSATARDARKQSFWERVLFGGPVSLRKLLVKEQALAREIKLEPYRPGKISERVNGTDEEIERLLSERNYGEARAYAWNMMEIARESHDAANVEVCQDYLEIIAERQSLDSGEDFDA